METVEIIGAIAAILSTISFIPQATKTIKTKDTSGLSIGMYTLFASSLVFWLLYGFAIDSISIYVSNAIVLFFVSIILFYLIKDARTVSKEEKVTQKISR